MAKSLAVSITQNSQSTANNTSSITVKATCTCSGDSWRGSSRTGTYTIKVLDSSGATLKTYYSSTSFTSGAAANSTTTLFSKTFTVTHDSTGYAKVSVSVTYDASSWNLTATGTKELTKIARSSSITSASAVTLGDSSGGGYVSIKWTPANSSYAYKLKFVIGSKSVTTGYITPNKTTAYTYSSYQMTIDTWAPYITTATTGTCTATLYTYTSSSSSTSIGSNSKTFTVTVPSSVVPTCTASISEGNSAVGLGVYLTGQSKLKVAVTATMKYASAISSISVKVGSTTYTASVTTTSTGATGTITAAAQSSTSVAITVTVKDKRGRSGTYSTTVTQESYSIPKINSLTIERCLANGTVDMSNGQYVLATYRYTVANVTNNTSAMAIKYKVQTDSTYATLKTESGVFAGTETTYVSTVVFSLETAYDFTFTVTDAITSSTQSVRVATALVILDLMEDGTGIAFGKLAETSGIMETAWPIYINTEGSAPGLKLTNTGDSGAACINVTNAWSGYSVELHVGSGGINRGLYDKTADNWIIYRDSDNNTNISNATKINSKLTVNGRLTITSSYIDCQAQGIAIANGYGVYHYLANGSGFVRMEYLNSNNDLCLSQSGYTTRIYGSTIISQVSITVSDERLKKDFDTIDTYSSVFDSLEPLTFRYKEDDSKVHCGFKYQDVKSVLEQCGIDPEDCALVGTFKEDDGETYGAIGYSELIPILVYEVQKLKKQMNA